MLLIFFGCLFFVVNCHTKKILSHHASVQGHVFVLKKFEFLLCWIASSFIIPNLAGQTPRSVRR